jgi:hypothetical protein
VDVSIGTAERQAGVDYGALMSNGLPGFTERARYPSLEQEED